MKWIYLVVLVGLASCGQKEVSMTYDSERLHVEPITGSTFLHVSYLQTETFGKVECNGMFIVDGNEALVIDTPADDSTSIELIEWIESNFMAKVVGVVPTHFHFDCLGGLDAFHEREIPSYSNIKTIALLGSDASKPQNGFDRLLELKCGTKTVVNEFLGEGHTRDNIVTYVPKDHVLFGGCMVKSIGAGKGNLEDANLDEWSETIDRVKSTYKEAKFIVPGHGKIGGSELLDYTRAMFVKQPTVRRDSL